MDSFDKIIDLIEDTNMIKKEDGEIELVINFKEEQTEKDCDKIKDFIIDLIEKTN